MSLLRCLENVLGMYFGAILSICQVSFQLSRVCMEGRARGRPESPLNNRT